MRRLLLKHFLLVRINKMPSVHGRKKRSAPRKAGRKSHRKSPRKSHRKSPRHVKSGHKRSKSGRRVRGGADLETNLKYKAATGARTLAYGALGAAAGGMGMNLGRSGGKVTDANYADVAGAAVGGLGMGYREYTRNVGKYDLHGMPILSDDQKMRTRSYGAY